MFSFEMQYQESDLHVLYPSDSNHELLYQHEVTPTTTLVELLVLADRVAEFCGGKVQMVHTFFLVRATEKKEIKNSGPQSAPKI